MTNFFEFQSRTKILSGRGALLRLASEIRLLGGNKAILISDETLKKLGITEKIVSALQKENIEIPVIFTDIPTDSSLKTANSIAEICRQKNINIIIGLGGGSVIDTSKGVRMILSQNSDDILKLSGYEGMPFGNPIPLCIIPTTSGTGSEVTGVAVIRDEDRDIKMEFISTNIQPDIAVLDPQMTQSMPQKVTAATGMDALCHAIEGYTCMQKNPLSDAYAVTAINIISKNLIKAIKNGSDLDARIEMANAALMAGISFSNSMVGIVHGIGHALGAVSRVPHGTAMNILLPHCMMYNMDTCGKDYAKLLLHIAGPEIYSATPQNERAFSFVRYVRTLSEELYSLCGLPLSLSGAGVSKHDFEKIAEISLRDGANLVNPKYVDKESIISILNKAY
ncbi:MAG: iron-containing alcohol dehydrogenase [Firmicutes bacterium]|nr:iron-containing alcohol dehydrogenase [Bacillota bacterium]